MINLLPNNIKIVNAHIYHTRVIVVIVFFLFCTVFIADVLLVPSYILINAKEQIINNKFTEMTSSGTRPHEALDVIVKDINSKLAIFPNKIDLFSLPIDGIDGVIAKKLPGIFIREFRYEKKTNVGHLISINGIATSREVLQNFVKELGKDPKYKGATLPLSNFISGSNIPFNLTLTVVAQ